MPPTEPAAPGPVPPRKAAYNRLLLLVAGLGGLLYGIDVGIIAGAFPYLKATAGLNAGQLSFVVAAVLFGSAVSTLSAGMLADWMGRKPLMALSGLLFVVSIPMIALSHGYAPLVLGRLLQGVSGGLVGVAIPLYLAECLGSKNRGKGTGVFQWMLVFGFVVAAVVALYFSYRVSEVAKLGDPARLFAVNDSAWRSIFWVSLPPGILFVIGSLAVAESPRWLFRHGRRDEARAALLRSRDDAQADAEIREMEENAADERAKAPAGGAKESLLSRRYAVPFLLACVILACNQATGVNSIIGYNADIFIQGGLSDVQAHYGNLLFALVNFLMTMAAVMLVDRKGRKFLLTLGTAGIIVSLVAVGMLFRRTERLRVDAREAVQAMAGAAGDISLAFDEGAARRLLAGAGGAPGGRPVTLSIIYSYGGFRSASAVVRSDDAAAAPVRIDREGGLPDNRVSAFLRNPFASLEEARSAPLRIENALITPVPSTANGWLTAAFTFCFMAFFAIGPGVVVWLALSELMPTRIRSNGMSIALTLNQAVSTTIAAVFLPTVGKYGYSTMFFLFAACTVVYFVTAAFFLPETKGKTLEEIEQYFEGAAKRG